jgi:hypothetical protein
MWRTHSMTLLKKANTAGQHSQEWLCYTFCQQFAKAVAQAFVPVLAFFSNVTQCVQRSCERLELIRNLVFARVRTRHAKCVRHDLRFTTCSN